jgi:peptidoglycan hydrolase CwlO-like protein
MQRCIWLMAVLLLLGSCDELAVEQDVLSTLKKIATYEHNAVDQQKKLNELEQKQNKLYDQIMSYGMKQFTKVEQLSKESLELIKERDKHIEKEHKAIQSAKREINAIKKKISQLHDGNIRRQATRLVDIEKKRYETYDDLYLHYKEMLSLEKDLYILLQNRHTTPEQLQRHIEHVNEQYKKLIGANQQFNEDTETYNKEMKRLYHMWK